MDPMVFGKEKATSFGEGGFTASSVHPFGTSAMLPEPVDENLPRRKRCWKYIQSQPSESRHHNTASEPSESEHDKTAISPFFPNLKLDPTKIAPACLRGGSCPYGPADSCPFMHLKPISFEEFLKEISSGTTDIMEDKVGDDQVNPVSQAVGLAEPSGMKLLKQDKQEGVLIDTKNAFEFKNKNRSFLDLETKAEVTLFPDLRDVDKSEVDVISSEPKYVPDCLNGGGTCSYGPNCPFLNSKPIPLADFVKKLNKGTIYEDKMDADSTQPSEVFGSEELKEETNSYLSIK